MLDLIDLQIFNDDVVTAEACLSSDEWRSILAGQEASVRLGMEMPACALTRPYADRAEQEWLDGLLVEECEQEM
jgi:hypothetical protein